jgi:hypothetical protein
MDIGLFFLGALGAILTVYLAKSEVIPEFRPIFDTSDKNKEIMNRREHIRRTEQHIDDTQAQLEKETLPEKVRALKTLLDSSLAELGIERNRLETLEREIKQGQILSRVLGFVFYIVLGGVFGFLLAGKVNVEGLSGNLPDYFEAIIVGATWTSYLSTIGFRSGQTKANQLLEDGLKKSSEKIEALKKEITKKVTEEASEAERRGKPDEAFRADKMARILAEEIDSTKNELQKDFDMTRQMIQRDVKGIL